MSHHDTPPITGDRPANPTPEGICAAPATLTTLHDRYVDEFASADPSATSAVMLGLPVGPCLPDASEAADRARADALDDLRRQVAQVNLAELSAPERITRHVLHHRLITEAAVVGAGGMEACLAAGFGGHLSSVLAPAPMMLPDDTAVRVHLGRLLAVAAHLTAFPKRLLTSAAMGVSPTRRGVQSVIAELDAYLATSAQTDPFVQVRRPGRLRTAWHRLRAWSVVDAHIRPAVASLRDTLHQELLPAARDDDRPGWCHVPGGPAAYQAAIAKHTSLDFGPDRIHSFGLDLLAEAHTRIADLGSQLYDTSDVPDILRRLRRDDSGFGDTADLFSAASTLLQAARQSLPDWFPTDLPTPNPPLAAMPAGTTLHAGFARPSADGQIGGQIYLPADPTNQPRYDLPWLMAHEAIPGHAYQNAAARAHPNLPVIQRVLGIPGYTEGWAVYTEQLAEAMGLLRTPEHQLAALAHTASLARAVIIDTGLHHHGWTRTKAIAFLRDNAPHLLPTQLDRALDAIVALPGHRLAYALGARQISAARDRARRLHGPGFTLPAFHDQVLRHGTLPLPVLDTVLDAWARAAHTSPAEARHSPATAATGDPSS